MRIGLFGDTHANLIALDAALRHMAAERLDQIVCLGDLAITGPHPHEVVERVRELRCPVVRGNWDDWALHVRDGSRSYAGCRPVDRWCAERLTEADLAFLRTFTDTVTLRLPDGTHLCCYHGAPGDYNQVIDAATPYETLDRLLGARRVGIFAGGHTHVAMLRRHGEALVINPGSISENWNFSAWPERRRFNAHAEYAVIECEHADLRVSFRRVAIDVDAAIAAAHARGMPGAREWAATWMPPPSH
jgi:putative phosphoesterase